METIFTAFALICALVCGYCAYVAQRACRGAEKSEARLRHMRGQVTGLEGAYEALHASHRKLTGQFHRTKRGDPEQEHPSQHYGGNNGETAAVDRDALRAQYLPGINSGRE